MYIHHVSVKILRVFFAQLMKWNSLKFELMKNELPGFHALPVHIHIFQHLHHQPSSTGDE